MLPGQHIHEEKFMNALHYLKSLSYLALAQSYWVTMMHGHGELSPTIPCFIYVVLSLLVAAES